MERKDSYQYLQDIYLKEGISGCYTGLQFRILALLVTVSLVNPLWNIITSSPIPVEEDSKLLHEMSYNSLKVILTQPFHNMMLHKIMDYLNNENRSIVRSMYRQFGYDAFFMGMLARMCLEGFLICSAASINSLLKIRRRNFHSVTEMMVMAVRDAFCRRISCPLQAISIRMAVFGLGWHWNPVVLKSCSRI